MMGWGGGMLGGGHAVVWLVMGLFWIALLAVIVVAVVKLLPGSSASRPTLPPSTTESPDQVLDRMFALGEIDEATYRARRTALAEMRQQP